MVGLGLLWHRGRIRGERAVVALVITPMALVVASIYLLLNFQHLTPQGRYLFPLLLPFGLATAAGWRAVFIDKWRGAASVALLVGLALMNIYCVLVMPSPTIRSDEGALGSAGVSIDRSPRAVGRLRRFRYLHSRSASYSLERANCQVGVAPNEDRHLFTAHNSVWPHTVLEHREEGPSGSRDRVGSGRTNPCDRIDAIKIGFLDR